MKKKISTSFYELDVPPAGGTPTRSGAKVFLVLFLQKKNGFLPLDFPS
jgi:hypothetical protein